MKPMRVLMLEAPESLLAERRRTSADCRDEGWNGVLHRVRQPPSFHQILAFKLAQLLVLRGSQRLAGVHDEKGDSRSQALGLAFAWVEGPKLRLSWADGKATVSGEPGA